jgi:hypothetical protein
MDGHLAAGHVAENLDEAFPPKVFSDIKSLESGQKHNAVMSHHSA